ncbi:glycosyltransferase family 4 protein [Candidatus Uhrbacteria bacterium]|nr:glycosyltransferase family 4 protein [Candidatus Uhrbacteria bacterium]
MLTYGIDASSANKEQRTGVEWYAYHLIQQLKAQAVTLEDRIVLYAPQPLKGDLAVLPTFWESRTLGWPFRKGWMQGRMSLEMLARPPNVFFVPSQALPRVHPGRFSRHRATVTTLHDVGFRRFPDLYSAAERRHLEVVTAFALRHTSAIFVPSEYTKSELIELYRISSDRLVVTPLAADTARYRSLPSFEIEPVLQRHRLGFKTYFLFIGRIETKKNVATLIRAFELFKQARGFGDPFELVLVGSAGFGFEEIKRYRDLSPVREAIRLPGWVEEADLPALLNGATAYLFPSRYEGFGIPNLEALACGTPLVTSALPVHREIVGPDAALFAAVTDPEAWAQAMRQIVDEPRTAQDRAAAGLERAKQYRWEDTAAKTWEILRNSPSF